MKLEKVREYLQENDIHGWLIYDFQGINHECSEDSGVDRKFQTEFR